MKFWNKDKSPITAGFEATEEEMKRLCNPQQPIDEWIWVSGFKATCNDLTCNDFQYELGKLHIFDGSEIELCKTGFHFCENFPHTLGYYSFNGKNRFFRVQGLVKKVAYEDMETKVGNFASSFGDRYDSKLVAKEILFTQELSFEDLRPLILQHFPLIETEEEYKSLATISYDDFVKVKFVEKIKELGIGELFANLLCEETKRPEAILKYATALVSENISKDILVYLLTKRVQ